MHEKLTQCARILYSENLQYMPIYRTECKLFTKFRRDGKFPTEHWAAWAFFAFRPRKSLKTSWRYSNEQLITLMQRNFARADSVLWGISHPGRNKQH